MQRKSYKTVLIVGAGASVEFGLPTGRGLLKKINDLCQREYDHDGFLKRFKFPAQIENALTYIQRDLQTKELTDPNTLIRMRNKAAWICDVAPLAPSIDNFIHTHQSDIEITKIGKTIIAYLIDQGEQNSYLADVKSRTDDWEAFPLVRRTSEGQMLISDTWLGELFRYLVELKDIEDFIKALRDITFITFNYDRCIEQFLTSAAQRYFQLNADDTLKCLSSINVIHPYGSLGELTVNGGQIIGFGNRRTESYEASKTISTFTEGMTDKEVGSKIHDALQSAERVFFLGFGFLDLNLELLFDSGPFNVNSVVGTHKGISEASAHIVSKKLANKLFYGSESKETRAVLLKDAIDRVELHNLTCAELLQQYQFFLRD